MGKEYEKIRAEVARKFNDRITELELENMSLKKMLSEEYQKVAKLNEENKALEAKIAGSPRSSAAGQMLSLMHAMGYITESFVPDRYI